jgi:hypothetical protein
MNYTQENKQAMKIFYIVPAWSDQAGQCKIVMREFERKINAADSYRSTPELWEEAGLMNSQGKLVCLNDKQAASEMSQDEPLCAGMQYSFPLETEIDVNDAPELRPSLA